MQVALGENWGNPSSVHAVGARARRAVEDSRESLAELLGCSERELILTSGGTESCNLAIQGRLSADPSRRVIVTTRFEHSAVRDCAQLCGQQGREVIWLEGDHDGVVDPRALEDILEVRAREIAVVSVMWANNETGVLQPIVQLGELCRQHGVCFHSDATQWVGRMPTDLGAIEVDLLTLSAHKMHGPKGVGALYCRRGVMLTPMMIGGPQERDRRGGTENVPGIVGLGVAARLTRAWFGQSAIALGAESGAELRAELRAELGGESGGESGQQTAWELGGALRDRFESAVAAELPSAVVLAHGRPRLWNTSNIAFPKLQAEAILIALNQRGVCASAGAACSSGSLDPSPVLLAMGTAPEIAHGAVRFSFSRETTEAEINAAAALVVDAVKQLSKSLP